MSLNKAFWEKKYKSKTLGWDIGYISSPLKAYIDQLTDKTIKILIPGAGNGYEVAYLIAQGFHNIVVIDIAQIPIYQLKKQFPTFPKERFIEGDFFDVTLGEFDLILEQTFFCALDPNLRTDYVEKMAQLLKPGGRLVGLLFIFPLTKEGPPFGGSIDEYRRLFEPYFKIKCLDLAYNSIKPRAGKELFFIFEK